MSELGQLPTSAVPLTLADCIVPAMVEVAPLSSSQLIWHDHWRFRNNACFPAHLEPRREQIAAMLPAIDEFGDA
jgi:hypothetical protein